MAAMAVMAAMAASVSNLQVSPEFNVFQFNQKGMSPFSRGLLPLQICMDLICAIFRVIANSIGGLKYLVVGGSYSRDELLNDYRPWR